MTSVMSMTTPSPYRRHHARSPDAPRRDTDAHGNAPSGGDCVVLLEDLKLGSSKPKPILLVVGDQEISCKVAGGAVGLQACFVKKV